MRGVTHSDFVFTATKTLAVAPFVTWHLQQRRFSDAAPACVLEQGAKPR